MNDFKMTDILKGFDKIATPDKDKPLTEVMPAKELITNNAAMKDLLEGLDAAQKGVKQMPGTHVMAKNTATKHPASNFLVGGEEGNPEAGQEVVAEAGNLRSVKVTFSDGNTITTDMAANLSDEQIQDYYQIGKRFNLGDGAGGDNVVTVSNVEVLDNARDKQRQQAMGHQSMGSVDLDDQNGDLREAGGDNFTADDLQRLGTITDLEQLKQAAAGLISNTDSKRPMKPEKVSWFLNKIAEKSTVASVIKMMWDLLLAGEGTAVIGTKGSTRKSSYRDRFGEDTIGKRKASSDVHKKQSLADIFHSMDETEEDKAAQFKKELHSDRKARELDKGDNGKFNLAEDTSPEVLELIAQVKRLNLFAKSEADIQEEFRVNNGETYIAIARKIVNVVKEMQITLDDGATTESNQTRSQLNKMVHRNQTK